MITSPLPWHIDQKPSGLVALKDANGQEIAQFTHYRDADFLLNFSPDKYRELEQERDAIQNESNDFEFKIGNLKLTIEALEKELKHLKQPTT